MSRWPSGTDVAAFLTTVRLRGALECGYKGAMGIVSEDWCKAVSIESLGAQGRKVVRISEKQIVVFRYEEKTFACDNRCPHEGFPLHEGALSLSSEPNESKPRCLVTCNWHNWKFCLTSGSNLFGGDELRIYPTRVDKGWVWVNVAAPPQEQLRRRASERLLSAIEQRDYPLITRELIRASQAGVSVLEALMVGLQHAHLRMPFGTTHAFGGLSDWLRLREDRVREEERLACLVEPLVHMASDTLRLPIYPYALESREGGVEELGRAIEAEDEAGAVGIVRQLLQRGTSLGRIERALCRAALAHYGDSGHSLIFVDKTFQAIERLGTQAALPLLLPLVRALVFATREELVPQFRGYATALEAFKNPVSAADNQAALAFEELGVDAALAEAVARRGNRPETIWQSLYEAASDRLYRFDVEFMRSATGPVSDNVTWLTVTHGITFSAAIWRVCNKFPELWPQAVLQLACTVGRNLKYRDSRLPDPNSKPLSAEAVFQRCFDRVVDHGQVEPVVSVHLLKTAMAARNLWEVGFQPPSILAGLERYFSIPMVRRNVLRTSRQSLELVGAFAER